MGRFWFSAPVILVCAGFFVTGDIARGWELTLKGSFNWRYEYYSQMGGKRFFGPHNVDLGTPSAGAAGPVNFWIGDRLAFDDDLVSGSDASAQVTYLTVNPQIRMNRAVRIRSQYRVGSWVFDQPAAGQGLGDLRRSVYLNSEQGGVQRSFSPGYWELMWLSAQSPWGILTVGKRPGKLGCGMMFDGVDNYTVETVSLRVPFGPLAIGVAFYPWRVGSRDYWNRVDRSAMRADNIGLYFVYASGPIQCGFQNIHVRYHRGPESELDPNDRDDVVPYDRVDNYGTCFAKYYNGRIFFNTELGWYDRIEHHQRSVVLPAPTNGAGSPFRPTYREHWRYMVETGACVGPAKLSFLWGWISGPDRRHGVLIDRTGEHRVRTLGNTSLFQAYSHILSYNYGGGNDSFTNARNGYMTDANAYGVRIDYAVAANLNFFGTFFWADRVSHGYGWGYIRPGIDAANVPTGSVEFDRQGAINNPAPAIPDLHLGYEIDLGFNWKLLEAYALDFTFGYWQPGRWFNYACVDRSNPGWKNQTAANNFGINPDRRIDPVFGLSLTLKGEF